MGAQNSKDKPKTPAWEQADTAKELTKSLSYQSTDEGSSVDSETANSQQEVISQDVPPSLTPLSEESLETDETASIVSGLPDILGPVEFSLSYRSTNEEHTEETVAEPNKDSLNSSLKKHEQIQSDGCSETRQCNVNNPRSYTEERDDYPGQCLGDSINSNTNRDLHEHFDGRNISLHESQELHSELGCSMPVHDLKIADDNYCMPIHFDLETSLYKKKGTEDGDDNRLASSIDDSNTNVAHHQICTNVIFLPDKSKGASPKRYGPKRLGSVFDSISEHEELLNMSIDDSETAFVDDESTHKNSMSVLTDAETGSIDEKKSESRNEERILSDSMTSSPQSELSKSEAEVNDEKPCITNQQEKTVSEQLMFVDDFFDLYSDLCAEGVSKDFHAPVQHINTPVPLAVEDYTHVTGNTELKQPVPVPDMPPMGNINSTDKMIPPVEGQSGWLPENKLVQGQKNINFDERHGNEIHTIANPRHLKSDDNTNELNAEQKKEDQTNEEDVTEFCRKCQEPSDLCLCLDPDIKTVMFVTDSERKRPDFSYLRYLTIGDREIQWSDLKSSQALFIRGLKSFQTEIFEDNRVSYEFSLPFYKGSVEQKQFSEGLEIEDDILAKGEQLLKDIEVKFNVKLSEKQFSGSIESNRNIMINDFDECSDDENLLTDSSEVQDDQKSRFRHTPDWNKGNTEVKEAEESILCVNELDVERSDEVPVTAEEYTQVSSNICKGDDCTSKLQNSLMSENSESKNLQIDVSIEAVNNVKEDGCSDHEEACKGDNESDESKNRESESKLTEDLVETQTESGMETADQNEVVVVVDDKVKENESSDDDITDEDDRKALPNEALDEECGIQIVLSQENPGLSCVGISKDMECDNITVEFNGVYKRRKTNLKDDNRLVELSEHENMKPSVIFKQNFEKRESEVVNKIPPSRKQAVDNIEEPIQEGMLEPRVEPRVEHRLDQQQNGLDFSLPPAEFLKQLQRNQDKMLFGLSGSIGADHHIDLNLPHEEFKKRLHEHNIGFREHLALMNQRHREHGFGTRRQPRRPEHANSDFAESFYQSSDQNVDISKLGVEAPKDSPAVDDSNTSIDRNEPVAYRERDGLEEFSVVRLLEERREYMQQLSSSSCSMSVPSSRSASPVRSIDSDDEVQRDIGKMENTYWSYLISQEKNICLQKMKIPRNVRCTVLCVDVSSSMQGLPWQQVKEFIPEFLSGIKDKNRSESVHEYVAMVTFGYETRIASQPTENYEQLIQMLNSFKPGDHSPLLTGLALSVLFQTVRKELGQGQCQLHEIIVSHRIILLSDGRPSPSSQIGLPDNMLDDIQQQEAVQEVDSSLEEWQLPLQHVQIDCVPFGENSNIDFLERLSKASDGRLVMPTDVKTLVNSTHNHYIAAQVAKQMFQMETDTFNLHMYKSIIQSLYPGVTRTDLDEMVSLAEAAHARCVSSQVQNGVAGSAQSEETVTVYEPAARNVPSVGTRVSLGPDASETSVTHIQGKGTVTGHSRKHKGKVFVQWDSGASMLCCCGYNDKLEVIPDDTVEPCKIDDKIKVGHRVRRGPDWQYGNQDGGGDQLGTVYQIHRDSTVLVRWSNGNHGNYRYNQNGVFDVLLSDPSDPLGTILFESVMNKRNEQKSKTTLVHLGSSGPAKSAIKQ